MASRKIYQGRHKVLHQNVLMHRKRQTQGREGQPRRNKWQAQSMDTWCTPGNTLENSRNKIGFVAVSLRQQAARRRCRLKMNEHALVQQKQQARRKKCRQEDNEHLDVKTGHVDFWLCQLQESACKMRLQAPMVERECRCSCSHCS